MHITVKSVILIALRMQRRRRKRRISFILLDLFRDKVGRESSDVGWDFVDGETDCVHRSIEAAGAFS